MFFIRAIFLCALVAALQHLAGVAAVPIPIGHTISFVSFLSFENTGLLAAHHLPVVSRYTPELDAEAFHVFCSVYDPSCGAHHGRNIALSFSAGLTGDISESTSSAFDMTSVGETLVAFAPSESTSAYGNNTVDLTPVANFTTTKQASVAASVADVISSTAPMWDPVPPTAVFVGQTLVAPTSHVDFAISSTAPTIVPSLAASANHQPSQDDSEWDNGKDAMPAIVGVTFMGAALVLLCAYYTVKWYMGYRRSLKADEELATGKTNGSPNIVIPLPPRGPLTYPPSAASQTTVASTPSTLAPTIPGFDMATFDLYAPWKDTGRYPAFVPDITVPKPAMSGGRPGKSGMPGKTTAPVKPSPLRSGFF